jgi:hypothetical protein
MCVCVRVYVLVFQEKDSCLHDKCWAEGFFDM